jgi:hypothetical protein
VIIGRVGRVDRGAIRAAPLERDAHVGDLAAGTKLLIVATVFTWINTNLHTICRLLCIPSLPDGFPPLPKQ